MKSALAMRAERSSKSSAANGRKNKRGVSRIIEVISPTDIWAANIKENAASFNQGAAVSKPPICLGKGDLEIAPPWKTDEESREREYGHFVADLPAALKVSAAR